MTRKTIKNNSFGISYEKIVHSTGLTIYLYENHDYNGCYALYGTNFGSYDSSFIMDDGKEFTVPDGIAHFLEHKLFESEKEDAFQRFAKTGASANAYTSFDKTCYLFSSSQNILQSIEILIDFVSNPYFTKESVAKEQGIIGQEITMYDDNPGWQVMFATLEAMFIDSPVKKDIAGTVETISKITPEMLYKCYNAFYCPKNMVLSIAGNFDSEEVLKLVDKLVPAPKVDFDKIKRIIPSEPDTIITDHVNKKMAVSIPMFTIGYKEIPDADEDKERGLVCGNLLMMILFGESSDFYCDLYEEGLINPSFSTEVFSGMKGREYTVNLIEGESIQSDEVFKRVKEYVRARKIESVTKDELDRAKKVMYGDMVRGFNSLESTATRLLSSHFSGIEMFDNMDLVMEISLDEINDRLRRQFREDRAVFTRIDPKEEV